MYVGLTPSAPAESLRLCLQWSQPRRYRAISPTTPPPITSHAGFSFVAKSRMSVTTATTADTGSKMAVLPCCQITPAMRLSAFWRYKAYSGGWRYGHENSWGLWKPPAILGMEINAWGGCC